MHMTAGFQIATVEFSPSFEIASIVLNSTSRTVQVQLPGAGPSATGRCAGFRDDECAARRQRRTRHDSAESAGQRSSGAKPQR